MASPDPALLAAERAVFERSPDWELATVKKALSLHPWLNSARETARLAAVKAIAAERRQSTRRKGA